MGDLAGRFGRRRVLWTALGDRRSSASSVTLAGSFRHASCSGVALVTWGFFGAHSIASSWVGLRATDGRAQAAALYLFFYYRRLERDGCDGRAGSTSVGAGMASPR